MPSGIVFADATQPSGVAADFPSTIGARILDTLQRERFTGRYTGLDNTSWTDQNADETT